VSGLWYRREGILAMAFLFLALLLRIGFVLSQGPGFYFEDSLDYDRAARAILETGHFDPGYYRFPLYPLMMAASYKLFGTGPAPFRIIQAILGTLTCAVVWRMARGMFDRQTGLLALFGMAVFPPHIILSGIEYPTLPGMLAIWAALWMLSVHQRSLSPKVRTILAIGASVGLACLIFPAGLALALFVLLWFALQRRPIVDKLKNFARLLVATAVLLAPWTYVMVRSGDFRPLILKVGLHLPIAPGDHYQAWEGNGMNVLRAKLSGLRNNPGWALQHTSTEFLHFWNPYPDRLHSADPAFREALHAKNQRMESNNPLVGETARMLYAVGFSLLLAAAGIGALAGWMEIAGTGILVGWPVVLALCYSLIFTKTRYRMPADPAFIMLGCHAVAAAVQKKLFAGILAIPRAIQAASRKILEKPEMSEPPSAE